MNPVAASFGILLLALASFLAGWTAAIQAKADRRIMERIRLRAITEGYAMGWRSRALAAKRGELDDEWKPENES